MGFFVEFKIRNNNNFASMIFLKKLLQPLTYSKGIHFSPQKYMKSITETALLYRPQTMVDLEPQENIKDRVVQTFFDSSNIHISVSEAKERLPDVSTFSTPCHSFYQINLPFKNNLNLRKRMTQFSSSNIRVGRLLQLMDYIAANVAYRYCTPDSEKDLDMNELDFIVVTAAIDQIEFYYPISNQLDCILSGYVSYVGTSSMEVHIDVLQGVEGANRLACSANFVMVARNKSTGKAHLVPTLSLQKEKQTFRIINELGQQRQAIRKDEAKRGLEIAPPTYEESVSTHKLIMNVKKQPSGQWKSISQTKMKNNMLMHIEDKNLSGKIFGGLIMRYAYEAGWLCASRFLEKVLPVVTQIDEVQFLAPVQIGSFIELTASICYVNDKYLHVLVRCSNSSLSGKSVLTNIFHITFQHSEPQTISRVYPQSLAQSFLYIEAKRRVDKLTHTKSQ